MDPERKFEMKIRVKRLTAVLLLACLGTSGLSGCQEEEEEVDFSGVETVCELATLQCYYHNVARAETEASGLFQIFGVGYKKIWTEYSGIVEIGIDFSKVEISQPDANGVVTITIPEAEILSVDLDEDSLSEPLTDTGFMTSISKDEETEALASAQENMEETAAANTELLEQAQDRAKELIEAYVENLGEQLGEDYTVEWIELESESES